MSMEYFLRKKTSKKPKTARIKLKLFFCKQCKSVWEPEGNPFVNHHEVDLWIGKQRPVIRRKLTNNIPASYLKLAYFLKEANAYIKEFGLKKFKDNFNFDFLDGNEVDAMMQMLNTRGVMQSFRTRSGLTRLDEKQIKICPLCKMNNSKA